MRILVATDFSPQSDRALRRALLIARQCDAAITILHVIERDQPMRLIERQRAIAHHHLEATVETLGETDGIPANYLVEVGDIARMIDGAADRTGSSLIVMGPHRKQFGDLFAGTIADRTIRSSRFPVLLANAPPSGQYRQSLLAVDFDDASSSAFGAAEALSFVRKSNLSAMHLFDAPAAGMMKRSMQPPEAVDRYVDYEAHRAADRLLSLISANGVALSHPIVRPHHGSPTAAILSCADDLEADLIIVGTNQRLGVQRFVLGSIARDVLLASKRDVLVVPVSAEQVLTGSKRLPSELECVH